MSLLRRAHACPPWNQGRVCHARFDRSIPGSVAGGSARRRHLSGWVGGPITVVMPETDAPT